MALQVDVLAGLRLQIAVYSSQVTPRDVETHWQTLEESEGFDPTFDEVIIYSIDAEVSALDFEVSRAHAQRYLQTLDRSPPERAKRSALVCLNGGLDAFARLHQTNLALGAPKRTEFKSFVDIWPALAWIEEARVSCDAGQGLQWPLIEASFSRLGLARQVRLDRRAVMNSDFG